ncbi:hypothetical protein YW5DRAFT_00680 [Streptomyces sp. Ncost-T6T-1]|uniref:hypothetical protein n=1 Tax=Streptomyces sp. Ncost-T6T-1 TaxID=1100828 RepID=UPI0008058344|nr:hypothetical protein [Streptomyces sp. Ncost-T6T-1]SBU89627.1 hypothetical protein YW5DRAFT_00680 [Streptomyces sp. Ncost-T6T-1]
MPTWISAILLPAVTTLFIGLVITPRLEARNKRISLAHQARDEFSRRVLAILSASARLRETPIPAALAEQRPALTEKLNAERDRWVEQLDEATRYMVDNLETFALGYATERGRAIVGRFVALSRAVVLSERTVEAKTERLSALAGPVQNIFFTRRWRVLTVTRSFAEFERAVAALDGDLPEGVIVPVPAGSLQPTT